LTPNGLISQLLFRGFLLSIAGTRPEPAVSVPSASGTMQIAPHWIPRRRIGRAHSDQAGSKLIKIGLSDDDGASALEPPNRLGICLF